MSTKSVARPSSAKVIPLTTSAAKISSLPKRRQLREVLERSHYRRIRT
jgi:hypothetical protein